MERLTNKIALITAAGQGIGRATACHFIAEGAQVWATDVNQEALKDLKAEYSGINIVPLDVTDNTAIKSLAEQFERVDILFNCAGYVHHGALLECDEQAWDNSFTLNVKSMYYILHAFLPIMIAQGGGSIINMSSVASSVLAAENRCVYGTTKAAIIGLTKSIAVDYIKQGIRCNAICPGTVDTPSLHQRMQAQGDYEKAKAAFIARQPMGRVGRVEEIAALAVYLAADESAYTTGTINVIDGGWSN